MTTGALSGCPRNPKMVRHHAILTEKSRPVTTYAFDQLWCTDKYLITIEILLVSNTQEPVWRPYRNFREKTDDSTFKGIFARFSC